MVINADGEGVPGILFNGVAYELEMIGASDVESLVKCIRVDKRFSDFATRINKVCRGIANCSKTPMDKDLYVDLGFCKSLPQGSAPTSTARAGSNSCVPASMSLDLKTTSKATWFL